MIKLLPGDWLGTFEGHKGAIWAVDISYNGTRAATGAADFTSNFWDAESGDCLASCTHSHIVSIVHLFDSHGFIFLYQDCALFS